MLGARRTTRRVSRGLSGELGRHGDDGVGVVAVLADGRVVTGGDDNRLLVWDPAQPDADPAELGRHDSRIRAIGVLPDGRVSPAETTTGCWSGTRPSPKLALPNLATTAG